MNGKRKIYFIVECIAILIGVLSFLGALPIKKIEFPMAFGSLLRNCSIFVSVSFEERRHFKSICFIIGVFLFISFPLTYHIDKFVSDRQAKNCKCVETLIIPSEFTPIKKGKIYDFTEEGKDEVIIFFARENRKSKELEDEIIKVTKRQRGLRIYYYNMDKMPEREAGAAKRFLTYGKEPMLAKISEGEVVEKVTDKDIRKIKKMLEKF